MSRPAVAVLALTAAVWMSSFSGAAGTTTAGSTAPGRDTTVFDAGAGAAMAGLAAPGTATSTFFPHADTRVEEANPSTNYGALTKLVVRGGATTNIESFIRFSVTGVYGPVQSATLTLRTASFGDAGTVDGPAVYRTTAGWAEDGISWSNRPTRTSAGLDDKGPLGVDSVVSYDVTPLIEGDGSYSFGLASTSGDGVSFNSRESAVEKPRLVVRFLEDHPPSPPANLQGRAVDSTHALLAWDPATDDFGVTGYQIFRDGISIATIGPQTSYVDEGVLAGETHEYRVRALDAAGSKSGPSNLWEITTPVTLTFFPRADTRAEEANPSTNYGGMTKLAARGGTSADAESFLRFRVGGVSGQIHSARLILRTASWSDAGTVNGPAVYRTTNGWGEDTVTWSNRPGHTSGVIDDIGQIDPDSSVSYDVESLVQDNGVHSFALATNSSDAVYFQSREVAASRPMLVVRFFPTDRLVMAAGDIACDASDSNFNGGLGTPTECGQHRTADLLGAADAILPLGDLQYQDATLNEFSGSYEPSWGRFKAKTHPTTGNHEYRTTAAAGYFDYWNGAGNADGRAGDRTEGYYSYNLGAWHMVALNSSCSEVGGCGPGSPQEQWLRADLASHERACTLAYWHHARFSSGDHSGTQSVQGLWEALYQAGADLVLTAHSHVYERFAPQNASGASDPTYGMRQFVLGTGGRDLRSFFSTPQPNSEVRNATSFGVLALTLKPSSYEWQFRPAAGGGSFTDSGTNDCHAAPPA